MSNVNETALPSPEDVSGCAHSAWREHVNDRLDAGAAKMHQLHQDLEKNTAATHQVHADTKELVEFFRSVQGAFRVLEWLGKLARPLGYIATAAAALWGLVSTFKGGGGR